MAIIKKTRDKRQKCGEKRNPALLVGTGTGTAIMENSMEFPQKGKNKTAIWSSNPTFGMDLKEMQSPRWSDICTPDAHCCVNHNCPHMKQEEHLSQDEMWYGQLACSLSLYPTHTHAYTKKEEYHSAIKEGNPAICDNTDEPWGHMLSEISQTQKDKYILYRQVYDFTQV